MNTPTAQIAAKTSRAGAKPTAVRRPFDVLTLRGDFPILQTQVRGKPLAYLDNAATR